MVDNPYWDAVKDRVANDPIWGTCVKRWDFAGARFTELADRDEYTSRYSWTITDPESVEYVVEHARGGLIDPMAGTGYWAYVLSQLNVNTICYDLHPGDNPWHHDSPLHVPVERRGAAGSVTLHPDRTLLLAWPPYGQTIGNRAVRAYRGDRVIYMGEGHGGCTGDDDLHRRFDRDWDEICEHVPVQWEGLHDRITVYQRRKPQVKRPKTRAHSHAGASS